MTRTDSQLLLGSHLSIAGGLHNALRKAEGYGFGTVAIFLRNQLQWTPPRLSNEQVETFRRELRRTGIRPVVGHAIYLVNLAGTGKVRRQSIAALAEDLDRCGRLSVEYLVFHPGSNPSRKEGARRIADALNRIMNDSPHRRPKILLENTAGQGNTLGASFEELAEILSRLDRPRRFGICVDTAHAFAAGYDISTPEGVDGMLTAADEAAGLERLRAVHLNDSKRELGSGVDRHAHIGRGEMGLEGFRALVNDERIASVPLILETPKGTDDQGRDWDEVNAETVRSLLA